MVISCSTCKREEKECRGVKYWIYAVLSLFQICRNLHTFFAKYVFQKFQSSQKMVFSKSELEPREQGAGTCGRTGHCLQDRTLPVGQDTGPPGTIGQAYRTAQQEVGSGSIMNMQEDSLDQVLYSNCGEKTQQGPGARRQSWLREGVKKCEITDDK